MLGTTISRCTLGRGIGRHRLEWRKFGLVALERPYSWVSRIADCHHDPARRVVGEEPGDPPRDQGVRSTH